jgi:hypothetical protein
LRRGESGEGERGEWQRQLGQENEQGGGGESAGVVDLSSDEPNMSAVFKEITGMPLNDSLVELEFQGHYSQYRWEILNNMRTVCLLTLSRGLVSLATMVSELASPLLAVGSGRAGSGYLFILAADADACASVIREDG